MADAKLLRNQIPTQEELLKLFRYEPETGKLFWLARTPDMFSQGGHNAAHNCAKWNGKFAGEEAFTATKGDGYKHGCLRGKYFPAQRIIWKIMTGSDPDQIDHIDGVRANNKWSNLRNVTASGNRRNAARHRDNQSGVTGVRLNKSTGKWQAFIQLKSGFIGLGTFSSISDAAAARKAAEHQYGFHPNHGRKTKT